MKTNKTLLLAGIAMSMAMTVGCKNTSKSIDDRAAKSPEPVFVAADAARLGNATKQKQKTRAALDALGDSRKALSEAAKNRDMVKEARDAEGNSVIKEMLSLQVEASIVEVQALEKNVKMASALVIAERELLNSITVLLSEDDKAKIGDVDLELQMEFDEKKARAEMSLEAARELTRVAEERVQELNARVESSKEYIESLDSSDQNGLQVEEAQKNLGVLLGDLEDANKTLSINMAQEDNLSKLFDGMSL